MKGTYPGRLCVNAVQILRKYAVQDPSNALIKYCKAAIKARKAAAVLKGWSASDGDMMVTQCSVNPLLCDLCSISAPAAEFTFAIDSCRKL